MVTLYNKSALSVLFAYNRYIGVYYMCDYVFASKLKYYVYVVSNTLFDVNFLPLWILNCEKMYLCDQYVPATLC